MADRDTAEYPKIVGWEPCPECGAQARREVTHAKAEEVDVLCTVNPDHNFRERPPGGRGR